MPHPKRGISARRFRARPDSVRPRSAETSTHTGPERTTRGRPRRKELHMRKFFEIGGVVAAAVLIAFGIAAIVMGVNGRSTVRDSLKQEYIVGSPDMTKAASAAEAKDAGLPASIKLPTSNIAGKAIDNGSLAREFA